MQIERRDQSKKIQKGDKNQKKITTESLRRGDGKGGKKGDQGGKRDGGNGKRNKKDRHKGRFGKNKKEGLPKDPQLRADALDKELEGYFIKGGDRALGKSNNPKRKKFKSPFAAVTNI